MKRFMDSPCGGGISIDRLKREKVLFSVTCTKAPLNNKPTGFLKVPSASHQNIEILSLEKPSSGTSLGGPLVLNSNSVDPRQQAKKQCMIKSNMGKG